MSGEKAKWRNTGPDGDISFGIGRAAVCYHRKTYQPTVTFDQHDYLSSQSTLDDGKKVAIAHARRLLTEALAALPEEEA